MAAGSIIATAATPEMEGAYAAFTKWCDDHNVSQNNLINTILPKLLFCLKNYTRETPQGPQVELNLGTTLILTRHAIQRQSRGKRRRWDGRF